MVNNLHVRLWVLGLLKSIFLMVLCVLCLILSMHVSDMKKNLMSLGTFEFLMVMCVDVLLKRVLLELLWVLKWS